jgi:hypothetical protein
VQCAQGQWTGVDKPACVLPSCGALPRPDVSAAVSLLNSDDCSSALPAAHGDECAAQCNEPNAVMSRKSFVCLFGRWKWPTCRTVTQIKEEVVAVQAAVLNVTALRQSLAKTTVTRAPQATEEPIDDEQVPERKFAIKFKTKAAAKQMQSSLKSAWGSMAGIRLPKQSDILNETERAQVKEQREEFVGQVYSLLEEQATFADAADPDGVAIDSAAACESWAVMQNAIGQVFDSSMPASSGNALNVIGNPQSGGPSFMAATLTVGKEARLRRPGSSNEYLLRTVQNPVAGAATVGLSIMADFSSALSACAAGKPADSKANRRLLADDALVAMSRMENLQLRYDGAEATIGDFAGEPNEFDLAIDFSRLSTTAATNMRATMKAVASGTACSQGLSSPQLPVCHSVQENDPTTTDDNVWDSSVCQTSYDAADTNRVRCSCTRYSSVMVFAAATPKQNSWCTTSGAATNNTGGGSGLGFVIGGVVVACIAAIALYLYLNRNKTARNNKKFTDAITRDDSRDRTSSQTSIETDGIELTVVTVTQDDEVPAAGSPDRRQLLR